MSPSQKAARQTRQKVAEMQAADRRKERRGKILTGVFIVGFGGALIGGLVYIVAEQRPGNSPTTVSADGVRSFTGLTQNHVAGTVSYPQVPPVGGDHNQTWQNCGIYDEPLKNEYAVHALEHGAVWITYRKDLPETQVGALEGLVKGKPYLLLSPHNDLKDAATASAWGKQLTVSDVSDQRLATFIRDYAQSPKAPEPGAPCTNGIGEPSA